MAEYIFINISQLGNRTAASNSDIMLIRSTGGIDSNISIEDFLKIPIRGKVEISLSNYDSDGAPVVKSGSVFENNGVGLLLSGDATPTGYAGITVGTRFYLKYDESESEFVYTETAPTWSDALQGWYNGTDRYFFSMFKDSGGTLYQKKGFLLGQSKEKVKTFTVEESLNAGSINTDNMDLKTKVIEIGAWNMDSVSSVSVAVGVEQGQVRNISAVIRNDPDTSLAFLAGCNENGTLTGQVQMISGNALLTRRTGGLFDSTAYNDTLINRGWINITYEG